MSDKKTGFFQSIKYSLSNWDPFGTKKRHQIRIQQESMTNEFRQWLSRERSYLQSPEGLQKTGGNLFEMNLVSRDGEESIPASGNPILGWDEAGNLRFGQILHKYLESSNVNPVDAMTNLIIFQRGYAMNAKAFTTGDDLIKEAINLKR